MGRVFSCRSPDRDVSAEARLGPRPCTVCTPRSPRRLPHCVDQSRPIAALRTVQPLECEHRFDGRRRDPAGQRRAREPIRRARASIAHLLWVGQLAARVLHARSPAPPGQVPDDRARRIRRRRDRLSRARQRRRGGEQAPGREGAPRGPRRGPGVRRDVPRRGAPLDAPQSPEHRPGARSGPRERLLLHRHGVPRGKAARPPHRREHPRHHARRPPPPDRRVARRPPLRPRAHRLRRRSARRRPPRLLPRTSS